MWIPGGGVQVVGGGGEGGVLFAPTLEERQGEVRITKGRQYGGAVS